MPNMKTRFYQVEVGGAKYIIAAASFDNAVIWAECKLGRVSNPQLMQHDELAANGITLVTADVVPLPKSA